MNASILWFLSWTAILAIGLYFPVSNMIWALSIRRLERKTGQALNEQQTIGQKNRARFISVFLVIIFAFCFNYSVFGIPKFS